MVSAKTIASDTPGYFRIMRIPSFTSSHENAGSHPLGVITCRSYYYRELYIVEHMAAVRVRAFPDKEHNEFRVRGLNKRL